MLEPGTHTLQITFVSDEDNKFGKRVKIGFGQGASTTLHPNHILARKAHPGMVVTFLGTHIGSYSEVVKKCFINYTVNKVIEMGYLKETTKFSSLPDRVVKEVEAQSTTNSVGKA